MKRRDPIIISARNYYGPCHNPNIFLEKKDGYEIFYNWSDHLRDLSKGFIYILKCQPGLVLTIARHYPSTPFSIPFEEEPNYICLSFVLGEGFHIKRHNQEQKNSFWSNQGYLTYSHTCKSGLVHFPGNPFCTIGILIEPWFIKRFWQETAREFAPEREGLLTILNKGGFFCSPVSMTPSINARIHEILRCTYTDAFRHHFLGSKALELMVSGFDQFNSDKGKNTPSFDLTTDAPNFIHKARDIMISDIKNPPSLTELSRMVGVNRTTLSQCFSKVYGVTIFDFLRTFRLEEAKRLLRTGNQSIAEVAFEVGYSQQRTFSREFKKYFGDPPSVYLG